MEGTFTDLLVSRSPGRLHWFHAVTVLLLLQISSGCSNDIRKYVVSGKITFQEKPIEKGEITFAPVGGLGRPDSSMITNGEFELSVTEGQKVVQASAWSTDPALVGPAPRDMPPGGINPDREYIPAKYNEASTLEAEVLPKDGQIFEFDLVK